ncbi:MAG: hypothetical protein HY801_00040, partial [Candidatus Lindowbacteria bacterium]|nr:hypothetical protein [Candidatus Lindowbacteria bacterium]
YCSMDALQQWLSARNVSDPWNEGNNIVNLASFYFVLAESGDERVKPLIEHLFAWHEQTQDPQTGYWLTISARPPVHPMVAMAGAAHNFHIYYYLDRPIRYLERIVDHCLSFVGDGVVHPLWSKTHPQVTAAEAMAKAAGVTVSLKKTLFEIIRRPF